MRRRAGAVAALAMLCLPGCTSPAQEADREPGPSPGAGTASSRPPDAAAPGGATAPRETTQPLTLVTHATRPRLRLARRQAERAVARIGPARRPRAAVRSVAAGGSRIAAVPAQHVGPSVHTAIVGGLDPMRSPRRYPLQVAGPSPPRDPVTLTVAGDLMLTRGVRDPAGALAPMAPRLRRADLAVANLESTLSVAGPPQQGDDSFGADPAVVGVLADTGFDAVSLANNHTGDFGQGALLETVRRLRESTVVPFGAGRDRAAAARPVVLRADGVSFGFLGFNAIGETPRATPTSPGVLSVRMPPRTGPLQRADLAFVAGQVRRLDDRVDVVVVLPHWGEQYLHQPEPVQRVVGRALVEAGADLVVGGHPHVVQGLDRVGDALLAHSLGNFVFDMDFAIETQQGVLLETTWWGEELKAIDLVPYRMDAAFAPRPAAAAESAEILGDVWASSTGPFSPPDAG